MEACEQVNPASAASCTACGAARWDGEHGQLRARVAAILRRTARTPAPLPSGEVTHGRLTLDAEGWRAAWAGAEVPLTVTEFAIVRVLAAQPRMVFTRDAIIDRVHGPGFAMTDRTIDSHVRNLRGKFAAVGGGDVIETRAGLGYQLGPCVGAPA